MWYACNRWRRLSSILPYSFLFTTDNVLFLVEQVALERYNKMKGNGPERLVSGSDDFTMFLWEPAVSKHPKTRMTGHQQVSLRQFASLFINCTFKLMFSLLLIHYQNCCSLLFVWLVDFHCTLLPCFASYFAPFQMLKGFAVTLFFSPLIWLKNSFQILISVHETCLLGAHIALLCLFFIFWSIHWRGNIDKKA